ncbi:MAG: T9SS type A sorting domain-containing protein [Bacteroidia bacterium]|nr:T9SS type A sorting domain-containing protein [Bacteroidia bacterium]
MKPLIIFLFTCCYFFTSAQDLRNYNLDSLVNGFPHSWSATHRTAGVSLDSTSSYSGKYCVLIADSWMGMGAGVGLGSRKMPACEGDTFTATGMFKLNTGRAWLYLSFWDKDSFMIDNPNTVTAVRGDWRMLKVKRVAPARTSYVTVVAYSSSDNVGSFFVDSLSLNKKSALASVHCLCGTEELEIGLFPNPTTDRVYFKGAVDGYRVYLINSVGAVVLEDVITNAGIDVSRLSSGVYTVVIYGERRKCSSRIVKHGRL